MMERYSSIKNYRHRVQNGNSFLHFWLQVIVYFFTLSFTRTILKLSSNSLDFCIRARAAVVHLNLRAGSTFPVPVCTVSPGLWVNNMTSRCNKVDAVRLYAS